MTDAFRDRERAFEAKYEHDEALRFRITTRRNNLLGQWIAGEIGLSGKAAEDYVKAMIEFDVTHAAEGALLDKALSDLTGAGIEISRHRLEVRAGKLLHQAEAEVAAEQVGTPGA
jgi:hypothetical protein